MNELLFTFACAFVSGIIPALATWFFLSRPVKAPKANGPFYYVKGALSRSLFERHQG
jgi:hypothetical protein